MTGRPADALVEKCCPFYGVAGVTDLLELTRQEIQERREAGTLLASSARKRLCG